MEAFAPWDPSFGVEKHALIKRVKRDQEILVLIKEVGALQAASMDRKQKREQEKLMEVVEAFEERILKLVGLPEGFGK